MINLDIIHAKSELLNEIWNETGNERAVSLAARWWDRWVVAMQSSHTFSREILEHYKSDASGLIEHTHKSMHYAISEKIFKEGTSVIETETNTDDEGRQHPYMREDRVSVYMIAKRPASRKGGEGQAGGA